MNTVFCANCSKKVNYELKHEIITDFKGIKVNVEQIVPYCLECGNDLFDENVENENNLRLYAKYKELSAFVTSKEISNFRERYNISQRELSNILGWGKMTINRYENGALQSQAHDDILRNIINNENFFKEKVEMAFEKKKISEKTYDKINLSISENFRNDELEEIFLLYDHSQSIYNGFTMLNFDKIKNLIPYLSSKVKLFKTKLNKLLWYIDFLYFKENTISITGLRYVKGTFGPMIENKGYNRIPFYLDGLSISIEEIENDREIIVPNGEFDLSVFSEDELNIIDKVIQRFEKLNTNQISDLSHFEDAWINTSMGELISYEYADNLKLDL